ncbi:MAG: T9SS type A sorting domain-containing protein, partial [Flavobacteriales bacterium]|nr:T9SS type A sorting domain-containing protein [Flavobacteriales bacterium]
ILSNNLVSQSDSIRRHLNIRIPNAKFITNNYNIFCGSFSSLPNSFSYDSTTLALDSSIIDASNFVIGNRTTLKSGKAEIYSRSVSSSIRYNWHLLSSNFFNISGSCDSVIILDTTLSVGMGSQDTFKIKNDFYIKYDWLQFNGGKIVFERPVHMQGDNIYFYQQNDLIFEDNVKVVSTGSCSNNYGILGDPQGSRNRLFISQDTLFLDNMSIQDLEGHGGVFIANSCYDLGNNQDIIFQNNLGKTLYWRGYSGIWHDPQNWSLTSGGPAAGCIPQANDTVIFDIAQNNLCNDLYLNYDFLQPSRAYCNSLIVDSAVNLIAQLPLNIFGDIINHGKKSYFSGLECYPRDTARYNFGQGTLNRLRSYTGVIALESSLKGNYIWMDGGEFLTNGHKIELADEWRASGFGTIKLNIDNSLIFCNNIDWHQISVVDNGSSIFTADLECYQDLSDITVCGLNGDITVWGSINNLTVNSNELKLNVLEVLGEANINVALFESNYNATSYNNVYFQNPGADLIFKPGDTTHFNGDFVAHGNQGFPIELKSKTLGQAVNYSFNNTDTICTDYLIVSDASFFGNSNVYVGANSVNVGNNTNINFSSCSNYATPIDSSYIKDKDTIRTPLTVASTINLANLNLSSYQSELPCCSYYTILDEGDYGTAFDSYWFIQYQADSLVNDTLLINICKYGEVDTCIQLTWIIEGCIIPASNYEIDTLCKGDSIQYGNEWVTEPGFYYSIESQIGSCDSQKVFLVEVHNAFEFNHYLSYCKDSIYTQDTTIIEFLISSAGCDSTNIFHYDVDTINTNMTFNGDTIFAQPGYDFYEWIDCVNQTSFTDSLHYFVPPGVGGTFKVAIDYGNCIDTSECILLGPLNTMEMNKSDFRIYPNPSSGILHVFHEGNSNLKVRVFNSTGNEVLRKMIISGQPLDIQSLPSGLYLINIEGGDESWTNKIIKE